MSEAGAAPGGGYVAIPGAMNMSSGAAPIGELTVDQVWAGLCLWARGDARFFPSFATVEILSDDGREILKIMGNKIDEIKISQRSTIREGHVITHDNLVGPWFLAMASIDTSKPDAPTLVITTLRHTLHPEYKDSAVAAAERGLPTPPTPQQNVERILGIVRQLVDAGEL